jgi:hypothetical protein
MFGSASSACSASVRAVRTCCMNCGRRAKAGATAWASGRAATMRRENMLRGGAVVGFREVELGVRFP